MTGFNPDEAIFFFNYFGTLWYTVTGKSTLWLVHSSTDVRRLIVLIDDEHRLTSQLLALVADVFAKMLSNRATGSKMQKS